MNPKLLGSLLVGIIILTGVYIGTLSLEQKQIADNIADGQLAQVSAPSSGLISHWKFDEGSGNSVSSSVGGASDTLGSPVWIDGKIGKALTFNGSDFVSAGDISQSKITISAWIKPENNSNFGSIAMKQNVYGLETQGGKVFARVGNGSTWTGAVEAPISFDTWQLVTQTFDGATNRLYINGSLVSSVKTKVTLGSTVPFLIGAWATDFSEPFRGGIDDVRVYNRALSATEVATLYTYNGNTTPTDTTAPVISNVSASNIKQTEATLTWTTNEASDTYVEFGLTPAYGNTSTPKDTGSGMVTSHTQTLVSLAQNTVYNYRVTSKDAAGNTAVSGNYTFTTANVSDTTAPTVPTGVTASNISQTAVTISWTASTDAVGVTAYDIYRNGSKIVTVTGTTYNDSGLTANTSYSYTVTAADAAGNVSAQSAARSVTTLSNQPTASLSASATSVASGQLVTLTWSSTNATSCTATGGTFAGAKGTAGIQTIYPTATATYGISCTGTGGTVSASPVTVTVIAAPTVSLVAGATSITAGQSSALNWSSTNATSCTATGGTFAGLKATSGTQTVSPTTTTTYGISCTGAGGTVSASPVTITVVPVVTSSLLSYWKFNQTSGTTVADSSGNNKTATVIGTPTWPTGVSGNAIGLSSGRYLNTGTVSVSAFTISAWVNMSSSQSGWGSIVMKQNSFGLEVQNGTVYANVGNGTTWTNTVSTPLTAGTWKHVVQTYDGTTNRIYVDGALKASGAGTFTNTASNLLIGSWNGTSEYFTGAIDEVQVYNKALTSTEVQSLYTSIVPPTTPNPTTYTVTVAKIGTGSGTVTCAPSTCTANNGSTVTVTGVAGAGSTLASLTVSPTAAGTCTTNSCTLTSAGTVTATFNLIPTTGGVSFYMTPTGAGATDGTSWANAFAGTTDINWASVKAGTTLYVGAGNYGTLTVGSSGSSVTNRVTIKAAQDTNIGTATFSGVNYGGNDYVTIDGRYGSSRNFTTTGQAIAVNAHDPYFQGFNVTNTTMNFTYVGAGDISYNRIDTSGVTNIDAALNMVASTNSQAYGQTKIHDNTLIIRGQLNDGAGPDGIQVAHGSDIYNNTFQSVYSGTFTSSQHQDMLQNYGDQWVRVYNNDFIDSGDSMIDFSDSGTATKSHLQVYNNVFRRTIDTMGTVAIRLYSDTPLTKYDDIRIENNTFVDLARTMPNFGAAIRLQGGSTAVATNSYIRNNIFYNNGRGWPTILVEGSANGWVVSNNLINAGSAGNTNISGLINTNGQTGAPVFASYTPYSLSNNYSIVSTSASTIDKGTAISTFSTDKAGISRPQGSAWDIGAYEYTGTVTNPSSTKFVASDRVAATDILNVRSSPSASASLLGTQALGTLGTINTNSSNGVYADGYYWWNVNYDTGVDGWSVENYLVKYTAPVTVTATVVKAGTGAGTVTCNPVSCSSTTGSVTLTAAPAAGSTFIGWSGASCTGTTSCTITTSASVTATFNIIPVTGGTVFYIRAGASGNGTDWTNAYGSFPATLVRGATYYVADGVYGAYNFDDAVNGTQLITIKKAIQSDHGTETGWVSTYGDGEAQLGALTFSTDYYVIDGQKGSGSSDLADRDYGFYIKSGGTIISSDGSANYITIRRMEIEGTGRDAGTAADTSWPSNKGFYLSGSHTNWTISRIYLHDTGNMSFQWASLSNSVVENSYIARNESSAAAHAEGIYGFGSNNVIRNNVWEDIEGTGVVMISGNNWKVYNNVMFWTPSYTGGGIGNGAVADWSNSSTASAAANNLIYSNTIVNQKGYSSGFNFIHTGSTGNVASNNLRYLASSGSNTTGTNNITATTSPFVNWQARDFRLNSSSNAINAGATLGSEYATDLVGTVRPQGASFDAGAYEYVGTVPPANPNSTKFISGDRVATTDVLNVRSAPSASATLLGAQALAALGTVATNSSNGVFADGYYWWNVNYDTGVDGWSVENYLVKYTAPTGGTTVNLTPTTWNSMSGSSFVRGNTYVLAPGTYTAKKMATPVSGSTYITIKSDGTGQVSFNGTMHFATDNWIFDGVTRNESDWFNGASYGFRVYGAAQQIRVGDPDNAKAVSNVKIRNTYLQAFQGLSTTVSPRWYGLDIVQFTNTGGISTGIEVSKSFFQYGNVPIWAQNNRSMLVEYTAFDANESNALNHGEPISCYYDGNCSNSIVRFNKFRSPSGTAVVALAGGGTVDNFQFYGNTIWNADIGDGILGFSEATRSNFTNAKVYNNSIANKRSGYSNGVAFMTGSNNLVYNNVWYNTPGIWFGPAVTQQNNIVNPATDPFVNSTAGDLRLKASIGSGTTLSAPYNVDATGATRGADGVWDIGAYEFAGTVAATCTQTLSTGANVASAIASAANGSTICLNSGNYGAVNLSDITRTGFVTVQSASGVAAQMSPTIANSDYIRLKSMTLSNASISRCSTNIQIVGNTWVQDTGGISVNDNGFGCDSSNKNILIDGNTMIMTRATGGEGKITLTSVNGVTITKNLIQGQPGANLPSGSKTGGDGIQTAGSVNNIIIGPGNIFRDILQAPCGNDPVKDPHCDSIQIVDSASNANIVVNGNWFDNVEVTLQHHDWGTAPVKFTNNLVTNSRHNWSYGAPANNYLIEHNTFYNQGDPNWGAYSVNSTGMNFRNNIVINSENPKLCPGCSASYNLGGTTGQAIGTNAIVGTPTFIGGTVPTTWAGWQLAATSLGKGNASDGLDRGTNYFGPTP